MWIRIRAVIIEDEPLAAQYLAELLDETCQVEVVGSATEGEAALRRVATRRGLCRHQSAGQRRCFAGHATGHASAAAAPGLYNGKCEPRHGRFPAGGAAQETAHLGPYRPGRVCHLLSV